MKNVVYTTYSFSCLKVMYDNGDQIKINAIITQPNI